MSDRILQLTRADLIKDAESKPLREITFADLRQGPHAASLSSDRVVISDGNKSHVLKDRTQEPKYVEHT